MAMVEYKAKNVYRCGSVILLPGINEIDDGVLRSVTSHPLFKFRVDRGIISILSWKEVAQEKKLSDKTPKRGRPKKVKEESKDMTEEQKKEFLKLIPRIFNLEKLKEYQDKIDDEDIKEACKAQEERILEGY